MSRTHLISKPLTGVDRSHHARAFLASFVLHSLGLCVIAGLALFYHSRELPSKNGSAPGSPSVSLEKMVIISQPPQPPTPLPPKPTPVPPPPAPPTPTVATTTPSIVPAAKPVPPQGTVPVLAFQPVKQLQIAQVKTPAPIHHAVLHPATAQAQPKPAAATTVSSYTRGPDALPHPPYPLEARDLRETGIVVMDVKFDVKGDVAYADVAQSSGVPLLDTTTRSFIRANWHSPEFAGQTVSVPVQYTLQNL